MSYIKNTDSLVEGSSQLFFTEQRAVEAVQEDLNALDAAIVAEETRAQAAEAGLDSRLDVIEGSGEGSVAKAEQDAKDYADQKVAELVNSAPAVLDTLKELSDALGGDENFAVTVANQIGAVDGKVDQEISDRQAAVSAEQGRAQAAEEALDGRLDVIEGSGEGSVAKAEQDAKDFAQGLVSAEESARMAADLGLGNRLSSLEADPTTKSYVDGQVSAEQSAREAADSALDARLDVLEQDETTKAYVDQQVSAEQSRAEAAESALDARLDVLETDPTTKAYVDGQVSAEQSARESADQALDGRLDVLETDPTTKSYVDGIQSALDGRLDALEADPTTKAYVDGEVSDLQGQITQEISDRQSAVSAEQSARESADSALDARLDVLESDPTTKAYVDGEITSVEGQISQEISNRQAAVSGEQSRAEAAEAALDGRLDVLEADPTTKSYVDGEVAGLQGQVDTEKGRIDAILLAADADKDSFAEIVSLINSVDTANDSAFASYVLSNDAALAQEISDRQAAVSAEQSARESADSALDLRLDALEADPTTKTYVDGLNSAMDARVDALELDPVSKTYVDGEVSDLQGQITQEISDRQSAVSSEASARAAEDLTMLKLDGSRNMTGSLAFTGSSKNITWATDGGGNIGASGASRPSNLYLKDTAYIGGFISLQQNLAWVSDGSGDIGGSGGFRPNNVYVKTSVTCSGKAVFTQSNAATPGYCFGGATNFGMYYDTNTVGISCAGSAVMTFNAGAIAATKPLLMQSGYTVNRTAVAGNASAGTSSGLLGVTDTSSARTITLPNAVGSFANRHFIIKDESGAASATNYIRVQPGTAGQTLDGAAYYDIKVPYESLVVYSNGSNWFIV